ncbi:hypothetical protein VP01_3280g1, partial [Puccinia sorghi]
MDTPSNFVIKQLLSWQIIHPATTRTLNLVHLAANLVMTGENQPKLAKQLFDIRLLNGINSVASYYSGSAKDVYQQSSRAGNAVALSPSSEVTCMNATSTKRDPNLDLGCSISMTPYKQDVLDAFPDKTSIRLADHLIVPATHKGLLHIPLDVSTNIVERKTVS